MSKRVRIHRRSMTRSIARAVSLALVACAPEEAPGGEISAYAGDRWIGGVEELRPGRHVADAAHSLGGREVAELGDGGGRDGAQLLVIRRD